MSALAASRRQFIEKPESMIQRARAPLSRLSFSSRPEFLHDVDRHVYCDLGPELLRGVRRSALSRVIRH